jgi:rubredoxin
MIYQCSNCGNEFEGEYGVTTNCPACNADRSHFVEQPFNVLSEMESHYDLDDDE